MFIYIYVYICIYICMVGAKTTSAPVVRRRRSRERGGREPLHWRAKSDPKAKMLYLQSFPRKGVSLGYVGRIKT